jgi:putative transposase
MSFSLASQPSAAPTKSGRIAIMQELPQAAKRCRRCIQILSLVHKYLADGDWFKPFAAFGSSYEIGAYRDHVGAAAGCETVQLNYTDTQFCVNKPLWSVNSGRFYAMEARKMQGRFKGHHLRKYRVSQVGNLCVLTCVVIGREPVFQDLRAGRRVVAQFRSAHERGLVDSLAWVVMPDHFHWLVELRAGTLSTLMCQVKSRSSRMIQMANSHPGALWQRGYYERTLRRD